MKTNRRFLELGAEEYKRIGGFVLSNGLLSNPRNWEWYTRLDVHRSLIFH